MCVQENVHMCQLHVTCEACGYHHECVRLIDEACSVNMICHRCEAPLFVPIAADVLEEVLSDAALPNQLCVRGFALPYQYV